ncbi:MAG: 6-phosphogluconolactonase [Acidimicrobiales bacterium]
MKLITTENSEEFATTAASIVMRKVHEKPELTLTLPTGSTPVGLYEALRRARREGDFSLDRATVFMLDEYLDLPSYPHGSFIEFLRRHLGDVIFNDATTVATIDPNAHARDYDLALDRANGLDLAVIGVGRNGHVGFNEPGDDLSARTHVVSLLEDTLEANFAGVARGQRPTRAVTIGMADLRRARSILMLVSGDEKHAVADLLAAGMLEAAVPATHLLDHDDLTIVMAGELLRER